MQSNQDIIKIDDNKIKLNIIDNIIWETLIKKLVKKENINHLNEYIYHISKVYNIDKKNIIKDFLNYIIRNKSDYVTPEFLNFVENLLHSQNNNNQYYTSYSFLKLSSFVSR
jgi:hypothetical protein